jgi:group II intron reverse transcriptase/maturase
MQKVYDELYAASKNGNNFYKLLEIIGSEQNIRLAYRNLKTNRGSKTAGTDGKTIDEIKNLSEEEVITFVRNLLDDYKPKSVRRVFIPKPGSDKKRPLGIPCIWDRLIQQCILQVLEPICEPKFHNHSYGFRPNRGAHHAVSRVASMVNLGRHYYCVDVDIKGFFDNVNHGKLLKQIWTLGIRDKRLICIISKILKSEIEGEGIPTKGTPQGGLISPLLSLIVLNELDWWVSNQWETFSPNRVKTGNWWYYYAREYTNLKDGFIVRYADDFKIMCRTYDEAQRWYHATVDFLKARLKLDISQEKSKVVNLRNKLSDFLGFKIKAVPKGQTKYGVIAKTDMSNKAIKKAKSNLKAKITSIQKHTTAYSVNNYNLAVMGIQNYYCIATNVYNNLTDVSYALLPTIRIKLRNIAKTTLFMNTEYEFQKKAKGIRGSTKIVIIGKMPLLPITGVHHKRPMNFSQDMGTNYMILRGKTEYKVELSNSPVGNMVKLENTFNGLSEHEEFLMKKIDQYQRDMEQSKQEYEKPFAHESDLKEKLARQFELNAQLDLENGKVEDVDLNGTKERDEDVEDSHVAERYMEYRTGRDGDTR